MSSDDWTGHRLAYRCICSEILPPGVRKGLCAGCKEEERKRQRGRE